MQEQQEPACVRPGAPTGRPLAQPPPTHPVARAHGVSTNGITVNGWKITTRKGPIISDKDVDAFRQSVGEDVKALPEMLFSSSRVTLLHQASGVALDFTALDALRAWKEEGLPPLQVKVAQEWKAARQHEIASQKAVQILYDWTFTTPYSGNVVTAQHAQHAIGAGDTGQYHQHGVGAAAALFRPVAAATPAPAPPPEGEPNQQGQQQGQQGQQQQQGGEQQQQEGGGGAQAKASESVQLPKWQETTQQIDRGLLMERDPILFFDEVPLFESDLDDNGVSQVTVKLRVMPRAWLVLLRFWLRVDGCVVRLRETRLFCRHDTPDKARVVLREQRHCEGAFRELRAAGAPDEGPAYADGDAAAQVFQAVAPIGLKHMALHSLELPAGPH